MRECKHKHSALDDHLINRCRTDLLPRLGQGGGALSLGGRRQMVAIGYSPSILGLSQKTSSWSRSLLSQANERACTRAAPDRQHKRRQRSRVSPGRDDVFVNTKLPPPQGTTPHNSKHWGVNFHFLKISADRVHSHWFTRRLPYRTLCIF